MKLLVTLHPLEPFFFGGDRSFTYGNTIIQRSGGYFIHSLETPSQTTLFGALRYLGMKKRNASFVLDPSDAERIGSESYDLHKAEQTFGMIKRISGLFLMDAAGKCYIRTPMDHQIKIEEYSPWTYTSFQETTDGVRCFPIKDQFSAKDGLADSWLRLDDLNILYTEDKDGKKVLIDAAPQVGVSTTREMEGFFKKNYRRLKDGFCFAILAEVEEGFNFPDQIVFLGQNKSAFRASMASADGWSDLGPDLTRLQQNLDPRAAVAVSDIYLGESPDAARELYKHCSFVCVGIREHRTFFTNYKRDTHLARFGKGEELIRLIKAGSMFLVKEDSRKTFLEKIGNSHAEMAGFNQLAYGKG